MNFFNFNGSRLELNIPEILLFPEFKALIEPKRNITGLDPDGRFLNIANKEFTYIHLMHSWYSPICDMGEKQRHLESLRSSEMTHKEFNENKLLHAACAKFLDIQKSYATYRMFSSAKSVIEKLYEYFQFQVNLNERTADGALVYKAKDVLDTLANTKKASETLKSTIENFKSEISANSIRGASEPGLFDRGLK